MRGCSRRRRHRRRRTLPAGQQAHDHTQYCALHDRWRVRQCARQAGLRGPAGLANDQRTLGELGVPLPVAAPTATATEPTQDIPAFGACARPTTEERAQIARAIAAADHDAKAAQLTFGCKDPNGVVVDVAYDRKGRNDRLIGVWKIVRASSTAANARVTRLVEYVGESQESWMEWSNEVTVTTNLLVDRSVPVVRPPRSARTSPPPRALPSAP
ncbi:MAG: hypothetical protein ABIY55_04705 [Kofleriaceae bacterium]